MQALAEVGRLRFVECAELCCNTAWFGHELMQTALTAHATGTGGLSLSKKDLANAGSVQAALLLLFGGEHGSPMSAAPTEATRSTMPLYNLGEAIGSGTNGVVHDATSVARQAGSGGGATTRHRVPQSGSRDGFRPGNAAPPGQSHPPSASPKLGVAKGSGLASGKFRLHARDDSKKDVCVGYSIPRDDHDP